MKSDTFCIVFHWSRQFGKKQTASSVTFFHCIEFFGVQVRDKEVLNGQDARNHDSLLYSSFDCMISDHIFKLLINACLKMQWHYLL